MCVSIRCKILDEIVSREYNNERNEYVSSKLIKINFENFENRV